jgi:DNA-binding MarR family transcriptional regulator
MAAPRWLTAHELDVWLTFERARLLLADELDRQLRHDHGLPHTYYMILAMLSEAPDRTLRMSTLSATTRYSPSRLSHAVARLEADGYVVRRPCPEDRRGQNATLTDEGFAKLAAAAPSHVETVRRHVFDQLSADQVDQLGAIAAALVTSLDPEDVSAFEA